MSYETKLGRILSGEYLADCDSQDDDSDEHVLTQGALKPSRSTFSIPIFDPQRQDIFSPSPSKALEFRIPPLDLPSGEIRLSTPSKESCEEVRPNQKSSMIPISSQTVADVPGYPTTLVEQSERHNKPLPPLPSGRLSACLSAYIPWQSKSIDSKKPSPSGDIPGPSQMPNSHDEPPDGGTMAWLHVLAGHLVIFNAQ
ncbi:MAG: hypothetical protein Q9163_001610 [Psora crenata]